MPRRAHRSAAGIVAWWCALIFASVSLAQIDENSLRGDLAQLAASPDRSIGSDGYNAAVAFVEDQIKQLGPAVELRRHEYTVMVPVTESAEMEIAGAADRQTIHPFWPAGIRPNATPPDGIRGRLVYCGRGELGQISPRDVRGNIAVIEASAGNLWHQVMSFGATAVIVLEDDAVNHVDLREHELLIPANLPRFWLPRGELADRLRRGGVTDEITLRAKVSWQPRTAVNLYALVRGKPPSGDARAPAAIMISSSLDASSLVQGLAPGASQAVQPAAAIQLLRDFARAPPARPIVFAFTGADSIQLLGQRQMMMALADPPATWRKEIATIARDLAAARADGERLAALGDDAGKLDVVRDRRLVDRIVRLIETDTALAQDELFRLRREREENLTDELLLRRETLEKRGIRLNAVRFAFQAQPQRLAAGAEFAGDAKEFLARSAERLDGLVRDYEARTAALRQRVALYEWLADALGRDRDPGERDTSQRLIELQVGLDLSDAGARVGPMFYGLFQRTNALVNVQDVRDWTQSIERAFEKNEASAAWWPGVRDVFDPQPLSQIRPPQSYLCAPLAMPSELSQAWGVPGLSLITLDDLRLRRDTPADTIDRIDVAAIARQLAAVREVLRRAADDPKFAIRVEPKRVRADLEGQVVSPAIGRPVPDLPRPGFLISYYYLQNVSRRIPQIQLLPYALGVRRTEVMQATADAKYRVEGLPQLHKDLQYFSVQAYRFADDGSGRIVATSDLGKQGADLKIHADIRQDVPSQRLLVFGCEEASLVGLYDPRYLQELGEVIPLDARRNAEPQRYNALLHRQVMAGFFEPGTRLSLIFRYGRIGNRLLLLNIPEASGGGGVAKASNERGQGDGYTLDQIDALGPIAAATARDFWRLDERRLTEYRRAGVSSTLIDSLHAEAGEQLSAAEGALAANDALAAVRDANGAWANEARVYDATLALAGDVVRGAIFLLLLCAPFAFCVERLVVGTPNVYKQIAYTGLIFALMTAALWSFHPAFKISASPLIIVIAFAIIFMSSVVIWVVYSKFDVELKRVRAARGTAAGAASAEGTNLARASVLTSAVLLGIANMRKRKLRTLLTSLTIVLITFAVLCFTSSTVYVGTISRLTGESTSHPGVMVRQRSFRTMSGPIVQNLRAIVGPEKQIVERWWNVAAIEPRDLPAITAGSLGGGEAKSASASVALLGLSPGEAALSQIAEVIGTEKYARLENGERDIVYLSAAAAKQLGVNEGQTVRVGGMPLTVAGVFDGDAFDQRVVALSGEPLTPLRYTTGLLDASGRRLDDDSAQQLDVEDGGGAESVQYEHLPASQVAIVPAAVSRMMPNAGLRSVGVRLADEAEVRKVGDELSRRFGLALFAGYDDGVRMIAAGNLSDVSGGARVAIPLAIGGMIIFNTMMGSIAERKREIHVYTSLGLAPLHVGALFVAEAMTYGLIGTVFGYVIGQGVGTALAKFGWLGGATLNYSGTSAVMTMGLILLVVLLSALVPARLASTLAAPSIDRTWKVPLPQGDVIRAQLPFTINRTAAAGVLAYLHDFLDAHREGSIGKFSADRIEPFETTASNGDVRTVRGLRASIWLTPFDLGIRQEMELTVKPSADAAEIYEVDVRLLRLSGDDSSWYRMNRTFLTELRKQFLAWRSLAQEHVARYISESERLFHCQLPIANCQLEEEAILSTEGRKA